MSLLIRSFGDSSDLFPHKTLGKKCLKEEREENRTPIHWTPMSTSCGIWYFNASSHSISLLFSLYNGVCPLQNKEILSDLPKNIKPSFKTKSVSIFCTLLNKSGYLPSFKIFHRINWHCTLFIYYLIQ